MLTLQRLIQEVLSTCSDRIAIFNADLRLVYASDAYCEFIGYDLFDIQNMHISVFQDKKRYLMQLKPAITLVFSQARTVQHPLIQTDSSLQETTHKTDSPGGDGLQYDGLYSTSSSEFAVTPDIYLRTRSKDKPEHPTISSNPTAKQYIEEFSPIFDDKGDVDCVLLKIKSIPTSKNESTGKAKFSPQGDTPHEFGAVQSPIGLSASLLTQVHNPMNIMESNLEILQEYVDLLKGFVRTTCNLKHCMPTRTRQKIDNAYRNFQVLPVITDTPDIFEECIRALSQIRNSIKTASTPPVKLATGYANLKQCIHNAIHPDQQHLVTVHINQNEPSVIPVSESNMIELLNLLINHALELHSDDNPSPIDVLLHTTDESHFVLIRGNTCPQNSVELNEQTNTQLDSACNYLKSMGGHLSITRREGKGTTLTLALPKEGFELDEQAIPNLA